MKQTINLNDFRDAFYQMDRKENFSYEGLELLFNYFEEMEESTGEEKELLYIKLSSSRRLIAALFCAKW